MNKAKRNPVSHVIAKITIQSIILSIPNHSWIEGGNWERTQLIKAASNVNPITMQNANANKAENKAFIFVSFNCLRIESLNYISPDFFNNFWSPSKIWS